MARTTAPVLRSSSPDDIPPRQSTAGTPWNDVVGKVFAHHWMSDGSHWIDVSGIGYFHFREVDPFVRVAADADWEIVADTYHRFVLPLMLHALGMEVLHASAVLGNGGVVALCGHSGAGKSTLAYALSRRGYAPYADDALAFTASGARLETVPVPFRLRLRAASAAYFDAGLMDPPPALPPAPLAAICLLERVAEHADPSSRTESLSPAAAWLALLPHAYILTIEVADRKRRMVQQYADLTRSVPIVRLKFPEGLDMLPEVVADIEQALPALRGNAA